MRLFLLIGVTLSPLCCHSLSVGAASPAYGLVLAEARDVVSHIWGPPQVWDSLCHTDNGNRRLVLSLDPRLRSGDQDTDRVVASIPADSLHLFISKGFVDRLCAPLDADSFCNDSTADMTLYLRPAQPRGADTLIVTLDMGRHEHCPGDREGFAASLEFTLLRSGSGWSVQNHRVVMIT